MSSGSDAEKSEAPTPKRRQEAHKEGRVPKSAELSAAVLLLGAATILVYAGGSAMAREARLFLVQSSRWLTGSALTIDGSHALVLEAAQAFGVAVLPSIGGIFVLVVAVNVMQTRGLVSASGLKLKFESLNPVAGLKRMFGAKAFFTVAKAVVKLAVLGFITYLALRDAMPKVVGLSSASLTQFLATIQSLAFDLVLTSGLSFLIIAAADYLFEVWQFEKSLKMTKQEVVQEHKDQDGNPHVKSRIRALGQAMRRKRMLGDIKRADVVIVNPTHLAVALKYDTTISGAPIVLAMGERKLAQRIKEIAKQNGVPMIENRPLARALIATATVGKPIPLDLYAAVAEVLAYVYRRRGWVPA